MESEFLEFDNLPFKLMVIEVLMYEMELLGEPYTGGDDFLEEYKSDIDTISDEECIARIKLFIERGTKFFTELKIPSSLASKIRYLYTGEEMSVYYHMIPLWLDFEEFDDGAAFAVTDISEREIKQFPNLEGITFNMYLDPPDELVKKLEGWGIEVNPQD